MTGEDIQTGYDWPDFIGIGAIKSGTTWLHACIAEHPDIFTASTKEIEYFSARFELGADWYHQLFADANGKICGESTPAYMHTQGCAERIYRHNPNAKLIVCLRNPVERALSHFMMKERESGEADRAKLLRFDEVVRTTGNMFTAYGLYADQLEPYIDRFGVQNMHFVLFDEINANPINVVRETYQFLGADSDFFPDSLNRRINAAARYRNPTIFAALRKMVRFTEQRLFPKLILNMKTGGLRDRVLNWWRIPQKNLPMEDTTRTYLSGYFREPNRKLEQLTGIDASAWQE